MKRSTALGDRIAQQICLIVLTVSMSLSASAQDALPEEEAIAGAMAAMDAFMLGFNAREPRGLGCFAQLPPRSIREPAVTVWDSAEEFVETRAFETLPRTGWDHSHWLTRDVVLVSPQKVHIATVFQRFNSDNEILDSYESLYIITLVDGHWGTQARSSLAP